jgi:hypothetical protein
LDKNLLLLSKGFTLESLRLIVDREPFRQTYSYLPIGRY